MRFIYCLVFICLISSVTAQNKNEKTVANRYYRDARIYFNDGAYEQSSLLMKKAMPIFYNNRMWNKYLNAIETIAENYLSLQNSDSLKVYFEKLVSESVRIHGKNTSFEIRGYLALSNYYLSNEENEIALGLLLEAYRLVKTKPLGRESLLTAIYKNLALTYQSQGHYQKALENFAMAEESSLNKPQPSAQLISDLLYDYAVLLSFAGNYETAIAKALKSIEFIQSQYNSDFNKSFKVKLLLCDLYLKKGDVNNAEEIITKLIGNMTKIKSATYLNVEFFIKKGEIESFKNENVEALNSWLEAVKFALIIYGPNHKTTAEIYNLIAKQHFKDKKYTDCIISSDKALNANLIPDKVVCFSYIELLKSWYYKTASLLKLNKFNELDFEKEYLFWMNEFYKNYLPIRYESEFRNAHQALTAELVANFYQSKPDQAFKWAEMHRIVCRRSFLHIENPTNILWGVQDSILENIKAHKLDKLHFMKEINYAKEKKNGSLEKIMFTKWQTSRLKLESEIAILRKKYPKFHNKYFHFSDSLVAEFLSNSNRNETFLSFFECDDFYFKFLIQGNKIKTKKIPRIKIDSLISLIDLKKWNTVSTELGKELLEGFNPDSKVLVVVPDGLLWKLPFEILSPDGSPQNFIIKSIPIIYRWSVTDRFLVDNTAAKGLCFFTSNYKNQPNNRFESYQSSYKLAREWSRNININAYRRRLKGDFDKNNHASESYFKGKNIRDFALLHLSFFTEADSFNLMNSKILMSFLPDSISDGVLHLHELSQLNLPLSLLTLNTNSFANFDHQLHSLLAFQAAGVSSVLWPVLDSGKKNGQNLILDYYLYLSKGMTKAEALRQAKMSAMKKGDFSWASYRLFGEDGTLSISAKFRFPWVLVVTASILILFILIVIIRMKLRNNKHKNS